MEKQQIENALYDLNQMVLDGRIMDAFEKYYHDEVVMQENDLPPTVSKAANRERELEFLGNITEFRGASVEGLAVDGNISYVIWNYDYTHREWGVRSYTQVAMQEWKDGKIIREKFIYLN